MQQHAFSVRLDRHAEGLSPLRGGLRCWLADVGVPPDDREEIVLACWEAAANALEHPILAEATMGSIEIVVAKDDGHILVSVADEGQWRSREAPAEGHGLDLRLIDALMDRVEIVRTRDRTRVRMRRSLGKSH